MDNLIEGSHTLIVYSHAVDGKEMSKSREFTVDTNYEPWKPPELLLLSPLNQTYNTNELPLTFAVNETVQSASYVLDNKGNSSLSLMGNSTLTGLSEGRHKLTVTVWTEKGLVSQSIFFTVVQETNTQQQPLQSALSVAVVSVAVATVVAAVVVYLKKRKRV